MPTPQEHRERIVIAKRLRNDALRINAHAEDDGLPLPFSEGTMMEMRAAVDMLARHARINGVDISDLVGDNVGNPDSAL